MADSVFPRQDSQVRSLVRELDPICPTKNPHDATEDPTRHNKNGRSCMPHLSPSAAKYTHTYIKIIEYKYKIGKKNEKKRKKLGFQRQPFEIQ